MKKQHLQHQCQLINQLGIQHQTKLHAKAQLIDQRLVLNFHLRVSQHQQPTDEQTRNPHQTHHQEPHLHRDVSSIITFHSVPTDNYGAGYAVSLPVSMQPRTIFEAATQTHSAEPGALHIQRPRLLSLAMLHGDKMGQSSNGNAQSHREGKITVRLIVDIMQALNISLKTYTLFYKVAQKLGNIGKIS